MQSCIVDDDRAEVFRLLWAGYRLSPHEFGLCKVLGRRTITLLANLAENHLLHMDSLSAANLANSTTTWRCRGAADCAICTEPITRFTQRTELGGCGHTFHPRCIRTWTGRAPNCPLCRRLITR